MKQTMILASMLLFLLILANNSNAQEISSKNIESAGNYEETAGKPGTPNTMLFNTIGTQLEAELLKNAPMAYDEGTLLSYSFPMEMYVDLKIYDKSGKELKTIVSETMQPGSYSNDLNALGMKKGTYYYKLAIGSDITVKKVILRN